MRLLYLIYYFSVILLLMPGCKSTEKSVAPEPSTVSLAEYPIQPVNIQHVKLKDEFWLPIVEKVQKKTISYALAKCEEEGRMRNFLRAGGILQDSIEGAMPFDDTDLYKIIEGASNSLISSPDTELEILLDSLIAIIAKGQESDGYLTTWRTVQPDTPPAPWVKVHKGVRWESLEASHELYNPGHLYEAAVVHFRATGKKNFLDIAIKNADLLVKTFGDGEHQISTVPGHQIVETGLLQLYKVTKNKSYLDLAKYFLDSRGNAENHILFGPYSQDHLPVTEQREVVGHAVRAMYMYAAMTDVAALMQDPAYDAAVHALWENMVTKKMYITGGVGARHEGESFGDNYELPNLTAYSETCAAIGSVYWNHRMHQKTGEVKYFDIIERTLYNGMIAGLSLDGKKFFYPNALESNGKYTFNRGHCTRQGWFDCSCCPTNIIRFIPSLSNLIYSQSANEIFVNLMIESEAVITTADGKLEVTQSTDYPWYGGTTLKVNNQSASKKELKIRIPNAVRGEAVPGDLYRYTNHEKKEVRVSVDGKDYDAVISDGYVTISIDAGRKQEIAIIFDNAVHKVVTHTAVLDNNGTEALEYGPFVYAFEDIDQPETFDLLTMERDGQWQPSWEEDLLGGVIILESEGKKAIPYYAWSNRGVGKMKVWIKK